MKNKLYKKVLKVYEDIPIDKKVKVCYFLKLQKKAVEWGGIT